MLKNLNKSKFGLLILVLIIGLAIAGCSDSSDDEVVAKVGDLTVTKSELYDELVNQNGSQILNALIADKIMQLEVEKHDIEVTDEEIEASLEEMKEFYGTEEALNTELENNGLTLDDVRQNIRSNLLIEGLLEPYIEITDEELTDYFEKNKSSFGEVDKVTASHILLETEEEALDIIGKLDAGEDFAELAKEHSIDTTTAVNGGSLGSFDRSKMVEEFSNAAFSLDIDEISEPVKSNYGYHIIKVEDKTPGDVIVFEDHEEDIRASIKQDKFYEAYMEWYEEKVEEYEIISYLD